MKNKRHMLPCYVRAFRKNAGFSQGELSFLLGCERGNLVSHYELGVQRPILRHVLGLTAVFDQPAEQIYAGLHEDVAQEVAKRGRELLALMSLQPQVWEVRHKAYFLRRMIERLESEVIVTRR